MKLKVRTLNLDAAGKTIVILNNEDAAELGVHPLSRIVLKKGNKSLTVIVTTTSDLVKEGELAVYKEVSDILNLKSGAMVDAEPRKEMPSREYIRRKIDGFELNSKEIHTIVNDAIERNLNDLEMAGFVTALHIHGLTMNENLSFSKSMIETSQKLSFKGKVVDKHSVGGISGDKTSLLLVPIIAAAGLVIPKTSSRSITSPAGTADRMEVLAPVELDMNEIKRVVNKCNGCLVWGGAVDLAPADDLFIQIEHPLDFDPLMLPSVLSKKKVAGAKYVIIDIPTGSGAKFKTKKDAENIATKFKILGKKLGMRIECGLTKGDQPIGLSMGPALEAREALETIVNPDYCCSDLIEKVTSLSGILLKLCGKGGKETARKILYSGKAEKKLREIIEAQGGDSKIKPSDINYAKYKIDIKSKSGGIISSINDDALANVARMTGAPKDKKAGIVLNKKIGDKIREGEVLFTIYAEKKHKLNKAIRTSRQEIFSTFTLKKGKMLIGEI